MPPTLLRPPPELAGYVGDGDYEAVGRAFREQFVRLGGLRPTGCWTWAAAAGGWPYP